MQDICDRRRVRPVSPVKGRLPPAISLAPDETVTEYRRDRLRQHTFDSYVGISLSKFPEDLRAYEHLLWFSDATMVIELGVQFGASSLWFRDRLKAFAHYRQGGPQPTAASAGLRERLRTYARSGRDAPGSTPALVIGIDIDVSPARVSLEQADPGYADDITLIEASVTDPALPDRVAEMIPPGARCLVVEDSAHIYETTIASLRGFSRFVPLNGFFVVEDGTVDIEELRIHPRSPRGVLPAINDWLEHEGTGFTVRSDMELYGVTAHPGGFLERTEPR
jgi:cephalosporin hydroxylase